MEPGHEGPGLGAEHTFTLAGGPFHAVDPLHLSDVSLSSATRPTASLLSALPLFPPALRPSSSPSFLRAPLLLRDFPDLGAQRDGGQGVDLVRSGGAAAQMDRGSGSDQLQQVSCSGVGKHNFLALSVPFVHLFFVFCVLHMHMWQSLLTPTSVRIKDSVCGAPPLVALV